MATARPWLLRLLAEACDIGAEVGGLVAAELHVRHLGMGVHQELRDLVGAEPGLAWRSRRRSARCRRRASDRARRRGRRRTSASRASRRATRRRRGDRRRPGSMGTSAIASATARAARTKARDGSERMRSWSRRPPGGGNDCSVRIGRLAAGPKRRSVAAAHSKKGGPWGRPSHRSAKAALSLSRNSTCRTRPGAASSRSDKRPPS